MNPAKISAQLCEFISEATYEMIPAHVIHEAKRSLVNYFAVCLASNQDATITKAIEVYLSFSATSEATLIGRNLKTDILNAAALNAMAANVFDFDDTHIPTIIHPTAPVAAALFALSQSHRLSGKEFLTALILGIDIECRIGNAMSPSHYNRGWHITSTCGVFGAATACGKSLGLCQQQLLWMLGNASSQACGLVETLGTMSKSISVGNAARNGLLSALLAQKDFSGPEHPLEGPRGFLSVYGQDVGYELLTQSMGSQWEILNNTYKPYPCGVVLNPVIEACMAIFELIKQKHIDLETIDYIELTAHPLLKQRTDRPAVSTGRLSQVSAQHAVGMVLTRGRAGLVEFTAEAVFEPVVRAVGEKVKFIDDEAMQVEAAVVALQLKDGSQLKHRISNAKGSLKTPLTDDDLEKKLISSLAYTGSSINTQLLFDQIWSLEKLPDVSSILNIEVQHGA